MYTTWRQLRLDATHTSRMYKFHVKVIKQVQVWQKFCLKILLMSQVIKPMIFQLASFSQAMTSNTRICVYHLIFFVVM